MRKLSWIVAAVCLFALPLCAQSRHRGYQAAGGWHRKDSNPVPPTKHAKKKDKRAVTPPEAPVAQPSR